MILGPFGEIVGADVSVDLLHFGRREQLVGAGAGLSDRLDDDLVHAVGREGAAGNVPTRVGAGKTGVAVDGVDQLIETGPGVARFGIEQHGVRFDY